MKICVSQKQMQELEWDSIHQIGIPSIVLMEKAALAVVDCVKCHVDKSEDIAIVCGKGNNGADGIAVGRILFQQGYSVTLVTIGDDEKATEEYKVQEHIAQKMGMVFCDWKLWMPHKALWIIDGIFGIGLKREIAGDYRELIERIQQVGANRVIAIDIPSGISADTGHILGCALQANYTVTFGYGKLGMYLNQGREYTGELTIADIGFHSGSICKAQGSKVRILEDEDLLRIPTRRADGNKGTNGKLLIVAGSVGMSGAAYLSSLAAYRTGSGLVKILTVEENRAILQMQLPEAIVQGYSQANMKEVVDACCEWATAVIMGPGLGQDSYVKSLVEQVLRAVKEKEEYCPMVLDSDALNTIAKYPELEVYYGEHVVITPHMKEMSRLTGCSVEELKQNPIQYGRTYSSAHKVVCVLKDAVSVITDGTEAIYLTVSGNSALAKGGTGDVLSGMIGGLLCIGMCPIDSAAYGSYLHGRSGTLASKEHGMHGVMASELVDFIKIINFS